MNFFTLHLKLVFNVETFCMPCTKKDSSQKWLNLGPGLLSPCEPGLKNLVENLIDIFLKENLVEILVRTVLQNGPSTKRSALSLLVLLLNFPNFQISSFNKTMQGVFFPPTSHINEVFIAAIWYLQVVWL